MVQFTVTLKKHTRLVRRVHRSTKLSRSTQREVQHTKQTYKQIQKANKQIARHFNWFTFYSFVTELQYYQHRLRPPFELTSKLFFRACVWILFSSQAATSALTYTYNYKIRNKNYGMKRSNPLMKTAVEGQRFDHRALRRKNSTKNQPQ